MTLSEKIQEIQRQYNEEVELLSDLLKIQFDILVEITILRLLFKEENQKFDELELQLLEQEIAYFELKKLDEKIVFAQQKLEILIQALESI